MKVTLGNTIGAALLGAIAASVCVQVIPTSVLAVILTHFHFKSFRRRCSASLHLLLQLSKGLEVPEIYGILYNPSRSVLLFILILHSQVALLLYSSEFYDILRLTIYRLLDVLHAVFTVAAIYHYLIDTFGDISAIKYFSWYGTCQKGEWS